MFGIEPQRGLHRSDCIVEPVQLVVRGPQIKMQIRIAVVIRDALLKGLRRQRILVGLKIRQPQQEVRIRLLRVQLHRLREVHDRVWIPLQPVEQKPKVQMAVEVRRL